MSYATLSESEMDRVAEPASELVTLTAISALGLAATAICFQLLPAESVLDLAAMLLS